MKPDDLVRKLGAENERLRIALQKIAHPSGFITVWNRALTNAEMVLAYEAIEWACKIAQEVLGEKPEKKGRAV
jgi:hypothetical protein